MNATSVEQLPEIAAAHVLAMDLYWAVVDAWVSGGVHHLLREWEDLPLPQKRMYIAEALAFLERYRPSLDRDRPGTIGPFPSVPNGEDSGQPQVATGLRRSDKIIGAIGIPYESRGVDDDTRGLGTRPRSMEAPDKGLAGLEPADSLCIYCGRESLEGDYCSSICEINAQSEGA